MRYAWLALGVLVACKGRSGPRHTIAAAIEKLEDFADQVCECADRACADKVQAAMATWATQLADTHRDDLKPSDAEAKAINAVTTRLTGCTQRFLTDDPMPPVDVTPPPTADDPGVAPRPARADQLIRMALDWAARQHVRHAVDELRLEYVDAQGLLDETYGTLRIQFGRARTAQDDPSRRTGLPVPPTTNQPTECPRLEWSRARGWRPTAGPCREIDGGAPRCTVPQLWRRAIEHGAPADAVAVLERSVPDAGAGEWLFAISDKPRKVDIEHVFDDDCPLAVEQAPPSP